MWEEILESHAGQADLEQACIDCTVIRAHAYAAGAANNDQISEVLGRSRGDFGCKIHALTNALGLPVVDVNYPDRRVGGDGQTLSLIAFRYQLKQHGSLRLVAPHVTEVIENQ